MNTQLDIRPSPIAGQWYPAEAQRLKANIQKYIEAARLPALAGEVVAIISPHAGHIYSGPVAGYAFATLAGLKPDLVAVVSPMHYPYSQPLITSGHEAYATPLGIVPIDQAALQLLDEELKARLGFPLARVRNDPEHSLEIELPFLQYMLKKEFNLLPVMVRDQSQPVPQALGEALGTVLHNRNGLLLASTDLSHFYPQEVANRLDQTFLNRLEAFDPQGILDVENQGKGFACGHGAVAAVLWASQVLGGNRVTILHYATSGDISGDYNQVVGYGAAVVTRQPVD
jgi:AmmeMemoRadiSam system protein B